MVIKFKNARILKMNGEGIFYGNLIVKANRIVYIGNGEGEQYMPFDRVIDCDGNLLMPGFKNAHAHSAMVYLRSYADDLPLKEWLYDWVFPVEACLKPGDVYALSKLGFAEYLTTGITANFDMYFFPPEIAKASKDFGMRTVICATPLNGFGTPEELIQTYKDLNNYDELVSYTIGFHAEYTANEEFLKKVSSIAHELRVPVYSHISETRNETDGSVERHGMTPPTYFDSLGLYDYGGGGFHCNYFDEKDIEIYKNKGLYAVTCPGSNTKLGSGICPVTKLAKAGIKVAIGTDGAASNNALDMFREMFLVTGLQKLSTGDLTVMQPYQVLEMATVNGARCMGLKDADVLEIGKLADIIMIDMHRPNMQPVNNVIKNIVYSGSKDNVKLTMINGRILYEDGKFFLNEPIEEIYKKAQEITDRIKQEIADKNVSIKQ